MNLMMLSLPPNYHGSAMQQKFLTMPHGCLGSINWRRQIDSSMSPTHWTLHRRRVQDEGVFIHPNPNEVSKHLCNTKETGSWSQLASARGPRTTKSQIGWILSCFDWSTIWFFRLQPHMFLPQTEDGYITIPMFL